MGFHDLLGKAKEVEQEVVKLKRYNEDLIYEKEQATQKIIDLKAQLKFSAKEYRELSDTVFEMQEENKTLKDYINNFYMVKIKKLKEDLDREKNRSELYKEKYNDLSIEIEKAFDNWALGNFNDERYHVEIQLIVHKLER
jgi:chromosome segregation ATPase